MTEPVRVRWVKWSRIINKAFVWLTKSRARIIILYGSRGSSKSDYVAKQLVYNCLSHKYFKCILYRKNFNTIQESSYENIKQTVISLGLQSLFTFRVAPLTIICNNGNKFIARGGDDPNSLKSIKDPTCVWYEEDIPSEKDFAIISLTIRSGKADVLQEFFSINPEVEEDFQDNWFWKRFFEGRHDLSFTTTTTVEVEGEAVDYDVVVHHSVYQDNKWLPLMVKAQIEGYAATNPYLYSVYAKGLWTMKQTGGNFYKLFDRVKNTIRNGSGPNGLPLLYDQTKMLHISFDFNVNPYITLTIWQADVSKKTATQIDEICLPTPNNRTENLCRAFLAKYRGHTTGLWVYGDPSGKQEDTRTEKGFNDYIIILRSLAEFRPRDMVAKVAPPVHVRGEFINTVFATGYNGLHFHIGDNCPKTIADYMYLKEASDGTKAKVKEKNEQTGITCEKYGHTSDANDYLICQMFDTEFKLYQKGGVVTPPRTGKNISKNSYQ